MMIFHGNLPLRFKPAELQCFNWLYGAAPCFPLMASKINIITDPTKFYETLCERFNNANRRVSIASLYIGTGDMEKRLLKTTKENMIQNKNIQLKVLLDYQRGTRGEVNSKSLLQEFIDVAPEQCNIAMYQTPRLQGSWSKALPSRYNELIGLQHMKLYIADDSVLLSGANCSNDYFRQRQDRYVEIVDADLANFYCELIGMMTADDGLKGLHLFIDAVCHFSKKCAKDGTLHNSHFSKDEMVKEMNKVIGNHIEKWRASQVAKMKADDPADTWIFPLIQMGEFNITQDEQVTKRLFESAPPNSTFKLATGYFNLTDQYSNTLLKCKSNISLLMAHPNANGFLGAAGPAGGIPHAYSLIAQKFWQRIVRSNQTDRIKMLEYERPGWTFHAKGLWYYPVDSDVPWMTVVGSANLGERSARRDLEAQAAILTADPLLQKKLHDECLKLHNYATECGTDLQNREAPLWVRATVGLFRTYF